MGGRPRDGIDVPRWRVEHGVELFRRHGVTFPSGRTYRADELERLNENYTSFTHWNWHRSRIDFAAIDARCGRENIGILRRRYLSAIAGNQKHAPAAFAICGRGRFRSLIARGPFNIFQLLGTDQNRRR